MNRPIGQKYMRCEIFDAFYTPKDHGIGMGHDRVYIMHRRHVETVPSRWRAR